MPINLTTAITGVVLNGFTAPTYTLTEDRGPNNWTKQSVVTALGGTQTGVRTHSPSDPFTISVSKQAQPVAAPKLGFNGVLGRLGRNKVSFLLRKGTIPLVNQAAQVSDLRIEVNTVSGAEVNDKANLAAMLSAGAALLNREAANLLDATTTQVI